MKIGCLSFAHPWVLLLLLLVPLLTAWYLWRYKHQKPALQFSNIGLFKGFKRTLRQRLHPLLFVLRMVALAAIVIALARPQTKLSRKQMKVDGIDIVVTMDLSGTMLSEDFSPNRLEAAKKVAAKFIEGRKNDRIGLVVFAGEAFTQVPLTIDHQVLLDQLMKLKNGRLKDGTAMGDGLATAVNRIKDSKAHSKVIILLTDGVNNMGRVDPQSAADICALYGIRLYTIGVGSQGTAPYPARDPFGRVVHVRIPCELDEPLLNRMAQATDDGHYFRATSKGALEKIFDQIDEMEKTKIDVTQYNQTRDEYLPFLIIALCALASELLLQLFYFRSTP